MQPNSTRGDIAEDDNVYAKQIKGHAEKAAVKPAASHDLGDCLRSVRREICLECFHRELLVVGRSRRVGTKYIPSFCSFTHTNTSHAAEQLAVVS